MGNNASAPIGVFDSGLGGLTVAREIMRNLPNEKIVYFGDTARVPYGNKSKATVVRYSEQIMRFLQTQNIKAIVIACNTASAMALDEIRDQAGVPVLGVVEPGALMAVKATKNKRVGVIATKATIGSGAYTRQIHRIDPDITVIGEACPLLVPLVEEGWTHDPVTDEIIMRYLKEILGKDIDTLILGCTHYPLLRSEIHGLIGDGITLVNPAYETAQALAGLLKKENLLNGEVPGKDEPYPYKFFVSDDAERFADFANSILPIDVKTAKMIPIDRY
ncbi:MAG: glutamate racemase [Lachnospiraceae bacterium]|jgi:glutamate racemase|nr:glutamate racemase [Lachnospiraceae bacterium]MCI1726112.1 glutamate racemase [Lachnospiraceae bacterium]